MKQPQPMWRPLPQRLADVKHQMTAVGIAAEKLKSVADELHGTSEGTQMQGVASTLQTQFEELFFIYLSLEEHLH